MANETITVTVAPPKTVNPPQLALEIVVAAIGGDIEMTYDEYGDLSACVVTCEEGLGLDETDISDLITAHVPVETETALYSSFWAERGDVMYLIREGRALLPVGATPRVPAYPNRVSSPLNLTSPITGGAWTCANSLGDPGEIDYVEHNGTGPEGTDLCYHYTANGVSPNQLYQCFTLEPGTNHVSVALKADVCALVRLQIATDVWVDVDLADEEFDDQGTAITSPTITAPYTDTDWKLIEFDFVSGLTWGNWNLVAYDSWGTPHADNGDSLYSIYHPSVQIL